MLANMEAQTAKLTIAVSNSGEVEVRLTLNDGTQASVALSPDEAEDTAAHLLVSAKVASAMARGAQAGMFDALLTAAVN